MAAMQKYSFAVDFVAASKLIVGAWHTKFNTMRNHTYSYRVYIIMHVAFKSTVINMVMVQIIEDMINKLNASTALC
jgi:hypothetical protein